MGGRGGATMRDRGGKEGPGEEDGGPPLHHASLDCPCVSFLSSSLRLSSLLSWRGGCLLFLHSGSGCPGSSLLTVLRSGEVLNLCSSQP